MKNFTLLLLAFTVTVAIVSAEPEEWQEVSGYKKPVAPSKYKPAPTKKYVPKKPVKKYVPKPTPKYTPKYTPKPTPKYTPKPAPKYTPKPTSPPPPKFAAPASAYPTTSPFKCNEKCKPNSAKFMAYVCGSLYADAIKWGKATCKPYYNARKPGDKASQYQAKLCTYWTQRSIMNVVTSCFIEAHLRNEFIMKYGKEGPGIWYCRYNEFVNQVNKCYSKSLKYYPLGASMNRLESTVASKYKPDKKTMPPFKFTGASVAMCAYYNKDQVYHRPGY